MIDRFTTKRLILSRPTKLDLRELYELFSKKEVNKYNPSGPDKSISVTESRLDVWIGDWEKYDIGYFVLRKLDTLEFVGYAGVRLTEFKGKTYYNLAYRIEPRFQRKGLTFEACSSVLKYVEQEKYYPIMVLTKYNNTPSIKMAKKLSFNYVNKYDDYPDEGDVYFFKEAK